MKVLHRVTAWAAALLVVTGGVASGNGSADAGVRGENIYAEFCQGCHGEGKSGLVQFSRSREELQRILEGETDQMPDFYGIFSETEVDAIYAYLTAPAGP